MNRVAYAHEVARPLRAAFVGTAGHAFRNHLPSLPYAPIDLVALCDPDPVKAKAFARMFGASSWYTDLDQLLSDARPEAVLIAVTGFDGDQPAATSLVARCLRAECHVWVDKPVAADPGAVDDLIALRDQVGRTVAVGIKTMHYPAYRQLRKIVSSPEFGTPSSFTCRYPLHLPPRPGLPLTDPAVRSCLTHMWHPFGAALLTMGRIACLSHQISPDGGGVATATYRSGAVGSFHFSAGQAETSPLERLEVVGSMTNAVVDNATHLTWYRRAELGEYGRTPTYLTDIDHGPVTWQPELTLGQLYNNANFFQGYAPSLIEFARAAITGEPIRHGTLEDARHILAVFDALRSTPAGQPAILDERA